MITAVIAGAGEGKRLKGKQKAFLKLAGRELVLYSLDFFAYRADEIIVVLPPLNVDEHRSRLEEMYAGICVVAGGAHRQESVKNALDVSRNMKGIFVIHDVARPFITGRLFENIVCGAKQHGACVPGVPIRDTVKEISGSFVEKTVDREKLILIQTPQAFRAEILREAYRKAIEEGFWGSDDSILVERTGVRVSVAEGVHENIKITYPADLLTARAILENKSKWKKSEG